MSSGELSANKPTNRARTEHTQKQISYTLAPLRNKSSPSRSCRSVSIVFGCKPSALPVAVLSGRSSRTLDLIPYRASVDLYSTHQRYANWQMSEKRSSRKHQARRPSSGDDHILNFGVIVSDVVWSSVEALVDCHRSHDDRYKRVTAIR
jgi:hypothetical protein